MICSFVKITCQIIYKIILHETRIHQNSLGHQLERKVNLVKPWNANEVSVVCCSANCKRCCRLINWKIVLDILKVE
jgi:predicted metal-binding protein